MALTTDWLIGNANNVLIEQFRDDYTGDVETGVELFFSLCENTRHDITNATNATPIVITSASHGLTTGDKVAVVNVGGNGAAKGTFTITTVNANSFSLDDSAGDGDYTGGGEWYECIADASEIEFSDESGGRYLAIKDGVIPLTEGQQLKLIIYCLGAFRDLYNSVISVVARKRVS